MGRKEWLHSYRLVRLMNSPHPSQVQTFNLSLALAFIHEREGVTGLKSGFGVHAFCSGAIEESLKGNVAAQLIARINAKSPYVCRLANSIESKFSI
jgi:hypothetical protein